MHILFALQTAFSLWMLVDAVSRRCEYYWYFIIMMPFGEWVYFFTVKIHDPEIKKIRRKLFTKRTSLKDLRYHARTSPSVLNQVRLAEALHDQMAIFHMMTITAKQDGRRMRRYRRRWKVERLFAWLKQLRRI